MNHREFTKKYYPYAKKCEDKTGISAVFTLAQAAIESGWGSHAPGNMFFGVKASKNTPESKRQLLTTTEYVRNISDKNRFPVVLSCTKSGNLYRLKVKDWFRKYDTPAECFEDHANFLLQNKRYANALKYKDDPYRFSEEVARAGYATAPGYADLLKKVCRIIESDLNS